MTARAPRSAHTVGVVVAITVLAIVGGTRPAAAVPPAAPVITAAPTSPGQLRSPAWSFTGDPGAAFECRTRRGAVVTSSWGTCSSPQASDLTGMPDGTYTFEVRAVLGGATGPPVGSDYVLDTTPPDAPTFTASPASPANDPWPRWSFASSSAPVVVYDSTRSPLPHSMPSIAYAARSTAEIGDLVSLGGSKRSLRAVTVTLEDWAAHSDFPSYPAGAWQHPITVNVYSVDRSGPSPAPGIRLATDTATVDIPWRPEPDPTCPSSGPYVGYRASDGQCYFSVPAEATFDLTSLGVDLPAEVIVSVAFNTQDSGAAPTGVNGPYNLLNLAVTASTPTVGVNSEPDAIFYNSTFGGFYADGGAAGTGIFRRDTGWAPYTPAIEVVAGDPPEGPLRAECQLRKALVLVADWAPCTSPVGFDLTGASDGTYTLGVRAVDAAGNVGVVTAFDYTLDRSAPAVPILAVSPRSPGSSRAPLWTFSSDPSAVAFDCRLDEPAGPGPWVPCASPVPMDLTHAVDGAHGFDVRARNALGTFSGVASGTYVLDTVVAPSPPPTVPPPGPSGGGQGPTGPVGGTGTPASPRPTPAPPVTHPVATVDGGTGQRASRGSRRARGGAGKQSWFAGLVEFVRRLITRHAGDAAFPIALLAIVAGFLAVQDRIDRNDPKLALAPVYADPDLIFPPSPRSETP